jgi:protein TonB
MSSTQSSSTVVAPGALGAPGYSLHSDLAQYCLPSTNRDANRKLAYVNSICILFLAIGVAGINPPKLEQRVPEPVQEFTPVEIVQQPEPPKNEPQPEQEQPQEQPDTQIEMPQIATVVARDPAQVTFAVPVQGPVVFAPAKLAQAPPVVLPKPARPTVQKFTGTDGGTYPNSPYPAWAQRQGQVQEAEGVFLITVNPDGSVASVEIQRLSGSTRLANYAADWIKTHFKFPPAEGDGLRSYEKPFSFSLSNR